MSSRWDYSTIDNREVFRIVVTGREAVFRIVVRSCAVLFRIVVTALVCVFRIVVQELGCRRYCGTRSVVLFTLLVISCIMVAYQTNGGCNVYNIGC